MGKYLRLLRLQDQYVELVAVLSAGLFLGTSHSWVLLWAAACICLSIPAYIVNEIVDRADGEKESWNPIHVGRSEELSVRVVGFLFVLFSVVGFYLSWSLDLGWWGLAIWGTGLLYSLEPFRLKGRFIIDLFSQMLTWWALPFLAVVWGSMHPDLAAAFLIITSGLIVPVLFAYQIADFMADSDAKLQSTHVILGVPASLYSGFWMGVAGILLYVAFGLYQWAMWTIPLAVLSVGVLALYVRWMNIKTLPAQLKDMQWWVVQVKPLTQIYALGVVVYWWFA